MDRKSSSLIWLLIGGAVCVFGLSGGFRDVSKWMRHRETPRIGAQEGTYFGGGSGGRGGSDPLTEKAVREQWRKDPNYIPDVGEQIRQKDERLREQTARPWLKK